MKNKFTKLKGGLLTAAALSAFAAVPAFAQTNLDYKIADAENLITTYTDLGTTGTAITVANNDNASSAPQNIGFTFNFNGQNFTQFILNTNGFIKLGSTPLSNQDIWDNIYASTVPDPNLISAASGIDLQGAADQTANPTEFRVATTGTAPNRVTTIQFENLSDKATVIGTTTIPAQFTTMNFQIRLYEGSNNIDLVYGTWSPSANAAGPQYFFMSLKGSSGTDPNRLFASKDEAATPWSQTVFESTYMFQGQGYLPSVVVSKNVLPEVGRTFRFKKYVLPTLDAAVEALFLQGKMARNTGMPNNIQAMVINRGTNDLIDLPVIFNISGFQNPAINDTILVNFLGSGDTTIVNYSYMPTRTGFNFFVEAMVPADSNNTNNIKEGNIIVTDNTLGSAQYPAQNNSVPVVQTATRGYFGNTPATNSGTFLTLFETNNLIKINRVRAYIPGPAFSSTIGTANRVVFAVVLDENGKEIGRSADKTLSNPSELDKFVTFDIPNTPVVEDSSVFFVGLGLRPKAGATADDWAFVMGIQDEDAPRMSPNYVAFTSPIPAGANPFPIHTLYFIDDNRHVLEADIALVGGLGVKEDAVSQAVSVYPNPSNGTFHISAKEMKGSSNVTMEVRDLNGKLVHSANGSKNEATLELKNLSAGVYILQISNDQQVATKRLVIE